MSRESFAAAPKQAKQRTRKGWDSAPVRQHDHASDRPHPSAKALRSYGIQQDEARQQIRELQARY